MPTCVFDVSSYQSGACFTYHESSDSLHSTDQKTPNREDEYEQLGDLDREILQLGENNDNISADPAPSKIALLPRTPKRSRSSADRDSLRKKKRRSWPVDELVIVSERCDESDLKVNEGRYSQHGTENDC